ncbi:MAG: hypothetical protein ACI4RR_04165, partial [Eubacterium sp.]
GMCALEDGVEPEECPFTADGYIEYKNLRNKAVEDDFCVVPDTELDVIEYDKNEYELKEFGKWNVLYKK